MARKNLLGTVRRQPGPTGTGQRATGKAFSVCFSMATETNGQLAAGNEQRATGNWQQLALGNGHLATATYQWAPGDGHVATGKGQLAKDPETMKNL